MFSLIRFSLLNVPFELRRLHSEMLTRGSSFGGQVRVIGADQIINGSDEVAGCFEDVRGEIARPAGPFENFRGVIQAAGIGFDVVRSIEQARCDRETTAPVPRREVWPGTSSGCLVRHGWRRRATSTRSQQIGIRPHLSFLHLLGEKVREIQSWPWMDNKI
jgi:hypothetical protein